MVKLLQSPDSDVVDFQFLRVVGPGCGPEIGGVEEVEESLQEIKGT